MISLRQHLFSIIAVFLALSAGVVLGSTSTSERLLANVTAAGDSVSRQAQTLRTERDTLRAERKDTDRFIRAVAPMTVHEQLDQRSVALVYTWDVPRRDRAAMRDLLRSAGATVTGEVQLTDGLVDPGRADHLRAAVTGLLPEGMQLPVAADPGTLAGGLIGPLTLLNPDSGEPQGSVEERSAALRGLIDSGFVRTQPQIRPADLALVLTGGRAVGDRAGDEAATLARFATQVDRTGAGAVLAGRAGSASGTGAVGVARADTSISSQLSTVDNLDTATGKVATMLALREQWEERTGHYGTAGSAQGQVPNARG